MSTADAAVTPSAPTARRARVPAGSVVDARPRPAGAAVAALAGATVAVTSGTVAVALPLVDGAPGGVSTAVVFDALTSLSFGLVGAALAWVRARSAIGWLLLVIGVCEGLADLSTAWVTLPGVEDGEARTVVAWLASWLWFPAFGLLVTAVVALYPSGRAGSRARRVLVVAGVTGVAAVTVGFALVDDAVDDIVPGAHNPFAVAPVGLVLAAGGAALLLPAALLSLLDAGRRLWRSGSPEREQLAWLLVTVVIAVMISLGPWHTVRAAVPVLVPLAIGVGVVRFRLLDLQVVVRRTLLFVGLTGLVVAVFVATTAGLSGLVEGGPLPVALAASLVAVGLTPARDRLQRAVDRLVYGDRGDPVRAFATLGRHVAEHDGDRLLTQVVGSVAAAVRSPHVALLDLDGDLQAQSGAPVDGEVLRLPLHVGGRDVGSLLVAPRTPREGWSADDRALLHLLAGQLAVVAHAARLNAELAGSRDRVLAATAEERRRLHQELHDGLGPTLSGIALGLEAAEASLERDPERTAVLLARLRQESQTAGHEVRRLVEGLRPAALDGRGLGEALALFVDGLAATAAGRLRVVLELAGPLPPMGAEVDAAAYRIATEAVTNVVRHSGARTCRVVVGADDGLLRLSIADDGTGLPAQPRDGVGLVSMRRRAAELGGTWSAEPRPGGGAQVRVTLPLRPQAGVSPA